MASGPWITRPVERAERWNPHGRSLRVRLPLPPEGAAAPAARQSRFRGPCLTMNSLPSLAVILLVACVHPAWAAGKSVAQNPVQPVAAVCKPIYLTLDTGHMAVAPLMADILNKHHVKVTFFAANERTQEGDGSLGAHWAPWWRARAAEGHEFASHTWDHVYWRGDVPAAPGSQAQFRMRPSAGPLEGKDFTWSAAQYCEEIGRSAKRLEAMTGKNRCRCSGHRAARPRPRCWPPPNPAGMNT